MNSLRIVMYGRSHSSQMPRDWNCAVIFFSRSTAKVRHVFTNFSMPSSSISFLFVMPRVFSTWTSIGRPCMS